MITVSDVSVSFGGQLLFKDVDLKFTAGNCYGVIGANGAGKSTFLKVLCGDLEPTKGSVSKPAELRMSVLRQDHYAFDDYTVRTPLSSATSACTTSCRRRMRSTPRRISQRRTAPALPSWRPSSQS